jgi:hypothetical protein
MAVTPPIKRREVVFMDVGDGQTSKVPSLLSVCRARVNTPAQDALIRALVDSAGGIATGALPPTSPFIVNCHLAAQDTVQLTLSDGPDPLGYANADVVVLCYGHDASPESLCKDLCAVRPTDAASLLYSDMRAEQRRAERDKHLPARRRKPGVLLFLVGGGEGPEPAETTGVAAAEVGTSVTCARGADCLRTSRPRSSPEAATMRAISCAACVHRTRARSRASCASWPRAACQSTGCAHASRGRASASARVWTICSSTSG